MYEGAIQDLIDELGLLPGIGPKSAQRLAFHVLQAEAADVNRLATALTRVKELVRFCSVCYNVAESEQCRKANRNGGDVDQTEDEKRFRMALESRTEHSEEAIEQRRMIEVIGCADELESVRVEQAHLFGRALLADLAHGEADVDQDPIARRNSVLGHQAHVYAAAEDYYFNHRPVVFPRSQFDDSAWNCKTHQIPPSGPSRSRRASKSNHSWLNQNRNRSNHRRKHETQHAPFSLGFTIMKLVIDVPDDLPLPVELWVTLVKTHYDVHTVAFYDEQDATTMFDRWWREKQREARPKVKR